MHVLEPVCALYFLRLPTVRIMCTNGVQRLFRHFFGYLAPGLIEQLKLLVPWAHRMIVGLMTCCYIRCHINLIYT